MITLKTKKPSKSEITNNKKSIMFVRGTKENYEQTPCKSIESTKFE